MASPLAALLADLEAARNQYRLGTSDKIKLLLGQIAPQEFHDAKLLIRFHELLLFLRAFPPSSALIPPIEKQLNHFHKRVGTIREMGVDMAAFGDFDTSGIAGTTMQDTLSYEVARWLARRIPKNVEIAWEDFDDERAMGLGWPRFIPLLEEDSDVEANIPWRRWLDTARGREKVLAWLLRQFERVGDGSATGATLREELYGALQVPLRWRLENLKLSRTRNWHRPHQWFFHREPLITRKEVSLAQELAKPAPELKRLSRAEGEAILQLVREVMAVRYRELYGTTLGDPGSVVCAEVGRGTIVYLWNLPRGRRLPMRAYVAGLTVKNGVPINYIEAIGLCEWMEVGFNTFYTYRQGETAWIYAQVLRCVCGLTGARTISIYPYQIGQNNDEALDSGAFWFYRKLGFRSGKAELERVARKEEEKIAANGEYRTPRKTLARLAQAHLFYEVAQGVDQFEIARGAWDAFSTRIVALRVNRRMAREFGGEAGRIREASVAEVSRALRVNTARWSADERRCLANWSLVLALVPGLSQWSQAQKRELVEMIRAQAGPSEMGYLRRTQAHVRLRQELLRLGSS